LQEFLVANKHYKWCRSLANAARRTNKDNMEAIKKSPTITSEGASAVTSAAPSADGSTTSSGERKTTKQATSKQKRASLLAGKNKKDAFTKQILEQASRVRQSFERKSSGSASTSTAGGGVGGGGSSQNNKSSSSMLSRSAGVQHSAFQPYAAFGNTTSKTATAAASISSTTLNSSSSSLPITRNLLGIRRQSSSQSIDPALMAEQLTLSWNKAAQAQEADAISRSRRSRAAGQEVWEGREAMGKGPRRRRASISGPGSANSNNSMGLSTSTELEKATSRTNCNGNEDEDVRKQELLKNLYSGRRRCSAGDLEQDDRKKMNGSNTTMPHARKRQSASSNFDDDEINSVPRKRHSASSNFDLEEIQNNTNINSIRFGVDAQLVAGQDDHEDENAEPISTANVNAANNFISTPLIRESVMKKLDYEEASAASSGLGWMHPQKMMEKEKQDQEQDKDSKQYQELYQLALKYQERSSPQETVMLNAPPYEQIALNNNDVVASTSSASGHADGGVINRSGTSGRFNHLTETLIGNRRLRVLLELHHKKYNKAKLAQYRTNEARATVQAIHHAIPQGRFLTVDLQQGIWAVMLPLWSIHFVERALASYS
jgi:hypothetical protein